MHISRHQARDLTGVAEKHGLRLIVAFGSRVAGKGHAESDPDLAVLPSYFPHFADAISRHAVSAAL